MDVSLFFIGSYIVYLSYFIFGKFIYQTYFEKNEILSVKEATLLSIIILAFLGFIVNFIFPLNQYTNLIILSLCFLIYFFIKKKNIYRILILSLFFCLILFLVIGFARNPEDANLYHNSFIALINNDKISFGITNLHFRYGWTSFIQYLSALSYIPDLSPHLIIIQNNFFYCLVILIIFDHAKKDFDNKEYLLCSYSLLCISYMVLKFSKFSDWGIDLIPAILTMYVTLISFKIFLKDRFYFVNIYPFLLLIIFFIFFNRTTYIFIFLLPLVFLMCRHVKFKDIFKINLVLFFFTISVLYMGKNFINTSCLIYPIYFTCIETSWLASENSYLNVKDIYLSSKAWSMGFSDANNAMSYQVYISNFNWLGAWLSKHFLKVLEKIFSFYAFILLVISLIIFYLRNKKYKIIYVSNSYFYLILFFTFGSIFWFINSPLFRYGSGFLIVLSILIISPFVAKIISKLEISFNKISKFLLIFFILILSTKNFTRIYNDKEDNFLPTTFKNIEMKESIISGNKLYFFENYQMCYYPKHSPCFKDDISHIKQIKKKFGYKFYNIIPN